MPPTTSFVPSGRVSILYLNSCPQALLHCVAIWPSNFLVNNIFGQYFGTRACIYTCTAPAGVYIHTPALFRVQYGIYCTGPLIRPRSVIQEFFSIWKVGTIMDNHWELFPERSPKQDVSIKCWHINFGCLTPLPSDVVDKVADPSSSYLNLSKLSKIVASSSACSTVTSSLSSRSTVARDLEMSNSSCLSSRNCSSHWRTRQLSIVGAVSSLVSSTPAASMLFLRHVRRLYATVQSLGSLLAVQDNMSWLACVLRSSTNSSGLSSYILLFLQITICTEKIDQSQVESLELYVHAFHLP